MYEGTLTALDQRLVELFHVQKACAQEAAAALPKVRAGQVYRFSFSVPSNALATEDSQLASRQMHFAMVPERMLLLEAKARGLLGVTRTRRLAELEAGDTWGQVFIEYLGVDAGASEPFWVPYFRSGLLEGDRLATRAAGDERRQLTDEMKLAPTFMVSRDFLGYGQPQNDILAHVLSSGRVLVPFSGFYHAMVIGWVAIRFGLSTGARIGEIAQLRVGGSLEVLGANGDVDRYALLIPKGQASAQKFELNSALQGALDTIASLVSQRFYGGRTFRGRPYVPVVPYTITPSARPDAAYYFQNSSGCIKREDMALFAKLFMRGIADLKFHDGRFTFATAFALAGGLADEIGHLLFHTPRMARENHYDISRAEAASQAAARFNQSKSILAPAGAQ